MTAAPTAREPRASDSPHDLWQTRPSLNNIQQWARSRRVGPWSLLGAILTIIMSRVDPKVSLPAIVGGRGSLNFFAALVGVSGGGKSASISTGHDALDVRADRLFRWEQRTLGSGEGISAAFVERVKGEDGSEIVHHTDGVLLEAPEVDAFAALGARAGATLWPEIRKAWVGEGLGFQNRSKDTSLPVAAHSYRLGLVLGVQPERSAALLEDAAGGTPQRFVWFDTRDPDAPAKAPSAPAPIKWQNPGPDVIPEVDGVRGMSVCDVAWETIEQAALARLRGDGYALDGHALLARLKVAAALALLEMRGDVNDEDWHLAGLVMQHSDQTRQACVDALRAASREVNESRAVLRAEAVVKTDDHLVSKCMERIVSNLSAEWIGSGALRPKITVKLREHFELAVAELVKHGTIEMLADQYQGQDRTRYRLAQPSPLTKSSALPVSAQNPQNHADYSPDETDLTKSSALPEIVTPEPAELDGFELVPPPEERRCIVCQKTLAGLKSNARVCSPTCRKRLSRTNQKVDHREP